MNPAQSSSKYALVTGASSGIGWFIAHEVAQHGYQIIAVSNQDKELQQLKESLNNQNIECLTTYKNLADANAAKELFDQYKDYQVEVLVNNAGMLIIEEAVEADSTKAAEILQLHMNTTAMLCHFFGLQMKNRRHGFILNISSISAVMPYPTISLYGPTKTFIRAFSRAIRTELLPFNVVVTCALPGATDTALHDPGETNIDLAIKMGVMKKPQAVAKTVVRAMFKGRSESIPGLLNKVIMLIVPLIPHFIINQINRYRIRKAVD